MVVQFEADMSDADSESSASDPSLWQVSPASVMGMPAPAIHSDSEAGSSKSLHDLLFLYASMSIM